MTRRLSRSVVCCMLAGAACSGSNSDAVQLGSGSDAALVDSGSSDGAVLDSNIERDGAALADSGLPDGAGATDANVALPCDSSKAPDVGQLALQAVGATVPNLVFAAQPPGTEDWYLVRQTGQVLLRAPGAAADTLFLDLSDEIALADANDERGLLSIAFPTDYAASGLFYVMVTPTRKSATDTSQGDPANTDQVRQYQRSASGVALKETLVTVPASASNHNGGSIAFAPDGTLYVGTGDGGGSCNSNKPNEPQNVASLYGKVLRLDPKNKAGGYAAAGNPFSENPMVWHLGLRNPFRISVDRQTGDLFVGDVGQDSYEEVSVAGAADKGLNFGWGAFEGKLAAPAPCAQRNLRTGSSHSEPFFVADRRKVGCDTAARLCDWRSVIGGVVYRGTAVPKMRGAYVFGDYLGARMAAIYKCESGPSPVTLISKNKDANAPNAPYFAESGFGDLTAIVEDSAGEMYLVANKSTLYRVVPR